jgi:hypothetical protein
MKWVGDDGGIGEGEASLHILFWVIFAGGDSVEVILLVVTLRVPLPPAKST